MGSFNGFGTMFYGCSDVWSDGSYVATEWFAVVYLPVVPLRSVRMILDDSARQVAFRA